jgi:hypothetical protein
MLADVAKFDELTSMVIAMIKRIPLEAIAWVVGLMLLAAIDPYQHNHFTICPIQHLGFDWCPGCGLGLSISLLFRGDLYHSLVTHPLGLFAIVVLSHRIYSLIKPLLIYGKNYRRTS